MALGLSLSGGQPLSHPRSEWPNKTGFGRFGRSLINRCEEGERAVCRTTVERSFILLTHSRPHRARVDAGANTAAPSDRAFDLWRWQAPTASR